MPKVTTATATDLAPRAFGNRPETIWQLALRRLARHWRGWNALAEGSAAASRHGVYIGL